MDSALPRRGRLPLDPDVGGSHAYLSDIGLWPLHTSSIRFFCQTSAHERTLHFATTDRYVRTAFGAGVSEGNTGRHWREFVPCSDHDAYLPGAAANDNFHGANNTDTEMAVHPFGRGRVVMDSEALHRERLRGTSELHFSMGWSDDRSRSGARRPRWECDDNAMGGQYDTLHQVWVKMADGVVAGAEWVLSLIHI